MHDAIARYPQDRLRSAALPLLHLWQEHFGFVSDEAITWIATKLELAPINVLELVTFYPMFRRVPAGKRHIRVCRTLSCAMEPVQSHRPFPDMAGGGESTGRAMANRAGDRFR